MEGWQIPISIPEHIKGRLAYSWKQEINNQFIPESKLFWVNGDKFLERGKYRDYAFQLDSRTMEFS